jgi:hypothetical protein
VAVGWVVPTMAWVAARLAGRPASASRRSVWNRIASATIAVSSSDRVMAVVLARSPPCWRQAYSGSNWCKDGMLRANLVRSIRSGPSPGCAPLTSWPRARAAPRYGVPSVMSLRVISAPQHCSMYQRAISPPIEWHTNTTSASA